MIYVSRPVAGATHDFALLKKELPAEQAWFSGLTVRVDAGFQGFAASYECAKLFLPYKKPQKAPRSALHKFRNTQQARKRVVVEHSIGGLKRYRILADRLRMRNLEHYDLILEVCAGLWNFCLTR